MDEYNRDLWQEIGICFNFAFALEKPLISRLGFDPEFFFSRPSHYLPLFCRRFFFLFFVSLSGPYVQSDTMTKQRVSNGVELRNRFFISLSCPFLYNEYDSLYLRTGNDDSSSFSTGLSFFFLHELFSFVVHTRTILLVFILSLSPASVRFSFSKAEFSVKILSANNFPRKLEKSKK